MSEDRDFRRELRSLIEAIEQERAKISIVGRQLSGEEQQRLAQIEGALPHLQQALMRLEAPTPHQ